ncbi:MAG: HAD-IB family phosphatase [Erysipelotrichaceae bacterium]
MKANLYDFDKTIYDGDSTFDFYKYCLRNNFSIIRFAPMQVYHFIKMFLGIESKTVSKEHFYKFLSGLKDVDSLIDSFWKTHINKIKGFYKEIQEPSDIIISASPEFLLEPAMSLLNIKYMMASRVDKHTGLYDGLNCHGEEKVRRLYERFPDVEAKAMYTDSLSDLPLIRIANEGYMVKKLKVTRFIDK